MITITKFLSDAGVSLDVIRSIEQQMQQADMEITVKKSHTRLYTLAWSAFLDDVCRENNVDPVSRCGGMGASDAGSLGGLAIKKCFERGRDLYIKEYKEKIKNDKRFDGWY